MTTEALFSKQAYSLVDADKYDYIVYDPLNDDVASGKKFYNLDESNPDNAWQIVENNGLKYLYNIGAQQYATLSDKGNIVLTANAIPVTMTTTDDGIQLGTKKKKKWLFVTNNDVNPDETPTGIEAMIAEDSINTLFDLQGRRVEHPTTGIYIINGKKVYIK